MSEAPLNSGAGIAVVDSGAGIAVADSGAGLEGVYTPPPSPPGGEKEVSPTATAKAETHNLPPGEAKNALLTVVKPRDFREIQIFEQAQEYIRNWYDRDPNALIERLAQELTLEDMDRLTAHVIRMTKAPNYAKFLSCKDTQGQRSSIEFTDPDNEANFCRAVRFDLSGWQQAVEHANLTKSEHPASPDPDIKRLFIYQALEGSGLVPYPGETCVRNLVDRGSRISEENPPPLPGEPLPTETVIKI